MKWKTTAFAPGLICAFVISFVCVFEWLSEAHPGFSLFRRLEWITYDWRVRQAARHAPVVATNLGIVAIDEYSIDTVLNGTLPYQFGLLWPRQVYARMIDELSTQGVKAVAFDVLFAELRPDHDPVELAGERISSDEFFVRSLRQSGNVILASEGTLFPPEFFATNAAAVGHISAPRERDGILRRTRAFVDVRVWHPVIKRAAVAFGWDLSVAHVEPDKLLLPRRDGASADVVPLNAREQFDVGRLERALAEDTARPFASRFERPFRDERIWQLGIVLAAQELNLDLANASADLKSGRVVLPVKNGAGAPRVIPVDREGRFYIDWSLGLKDPRLTKTAIEDLLQQWEARRAGRLEEVTNTWRGKLAVIGSVATSNNLGDYGATALEQNTFLVSKHWNVANSLLLNRFITPLSLLSRLLIIVLMGVLAAICTWKMKTLGAVGCVAGLAVVYAVVAVWLFVQSRVWLPLVTPVVGSLFVTHVSLITYLVRVERRERRRTTDFFGKIVSPVIVRELLGFEKLSLGGARRNLTVFFADIRGFTAVTDSSQQRAEAIVASKRLTGAAAEKCFDAEAQSVLNTVNPYLALLADVIKKHDGTLDKYIGDCVMAFWGAPVANPRHAVCCVRAVIEAQRAIFEFNQQRLSENERRQEENLRRLSIGEEPLPMLEILSLGSGINTGAVTIGMIGSEQHGMNYTVFGREVNLASRLESASGRARILIGERTYQELLRDDPELAATCREQPPIELKGFRDPVKAYEVPWRPHDVSPVDAGQSQTFIRDKNLREDCY